MKKKLKIKHQEKQCLFMLYCAYFTHFRMKSFNLYSLFLKVYLCWMHICMWCGVVWCLEEWTRVTAQKCVTWSNSAVSTVRPVMSSILWLTLAMTTSSSPSNHALRNRKMCKEREDRKASARRCDSVEPKFFFSVFFNTPQPRNKWSTVED